jgi:hypothetical protein
VKKVITVDPQQFASIRRDAFEDEIRGIDPGVRWKHQYPDATEIEFKVDSFTLDFPKFEGDPKDLPKADIMEVELCQDGSIVYKTDGVTTIELPSIANET